MRTVRGHEQKKLIDILTRLTDRVNNDQKLGRTNSHVTSSRSRLTLGRVGVPIFRVGDPFDFTSVGLARGAGGSLAQAP